MFRRKCAFIRRRTEVLAVYIVDPYPKRPTLGSGALIWEYAYVEGELFSDTIQQQQVCKCKWQKT